MADYICELLPFLLQHRNRLKGQMLMMPKFSMERVKGFRLTRAKLLRENPKISIFTAPEVFAHSLFQKFS